MSDVSATEVQDVSAVSWRRLLLTGIVSLAIMVAIGCALNIAMFFFGMADLFAGVPLGLVALLYGWRYRVRVRHESTEIYGPGSRFSSIPQLASFGLHVGTLLLAVDLVIEWIFLQSAGPGFALGIFVVPAIGTTLCALAFFTLMSPLTIRQEQYAVKHDLPAQRLIKINYILGWVVWSAVILAIVGLSVLNAVSYQ